MHDVALESVVSVECCEKGRREISSRLCTTTAIEGRNGRSRHAQDATKSAREAQMEDLLDSAFEDHEDLASQLVRLGVHRLVQEALEQEVTN